MASPTAVTFATMAVASLALINVRSSLIMPRRRATPRNTRSYRGLVGGLFHRQRCQPQPVARDALAMATPVTDSVSPYRALKRQPTASLFFQGIVCSRANRDRSRQRCRLSIPSEEKCECGYSNNKSQFAHDGPLFLRR